jgi:DNA-binding response OmpR family regulator
MRALVVEDDKRIAEFVRRGLREQSFAVSVAHDGEAGLELAIAEEYDVIILDILLPRLDGKAVLGAIRAHGITAPVIMLTAVDSVRSKVEVLDLGADDYITKPFSTSELLARIRSIRRRATGQQHTKLTVGDLVLDPASRQVTRAGQKIELTAKEFPLLQLLMENAGHPVTRTMIIEHVWDRNFDSFTNIVDVHMSRLRAKIDRGFQKKLIRTIKGVGYVLTEED